MAGITLSKMQRAVRPAHVMWAGDGTEEPTRVDFGYYPGLFSIETGDIVQEAAGKGELDTIAKIMEPLLAWWDVLADDETRLPTDVATIRQMPIPFLMEIMGAMQEGMRPPAGRN